MSLRAARINAGLLQEEAASKIGISVYTLANYENGKTFPDVPVIQRIEQVYDVEYKDIFFSVEITAKQ
jgi:transcriptional regulator with XRE-family HTH domain